MSNFTIPTRDEVSENNQAIFDKLHGMIGFVPNLYAYYAHNETALADYLALQNRKSSLRAKEREIINWSSAKSTAANTARRRTRRSAKCRVFRRKKFWKFAAVKFPSIRNSTRSPGSSRKRPSIAANRRLSRSKIYSRRATPKRIWWTS